MGRHNLNSVSMVSEDTGVVNLRVHLGPRARSWSLTLRSTTFAPSIPSTSASFFWPFLSSSLSTLRRYSWTVAIVLVKIEPFTEMGEAEIARRRPKIGRWAMLRVLFKSWRVICMRRRGIMKIGRFLNKGVRDYILDSFEWGKDGMMEE